MISLELRPKIEPPILKTLKARIAKCPQAAVGVLIFLTCTFVYLVNNQVTLTSSDNVTHTLLAFNWLENQTLHFDPFREGHLYEGGGIPYYLVEAPNGHLTSRYPIGTALVSFPLYCIFYIYLKLANLLQVLLSQSSIPVVTSSDFEIYRRSFGKLAAALISSFTVVIFYWTVRLKFRPSVAILSTFTFAFATGTWVINAQDLRQHTISNLLLTSIILCLFKAERTDGRYRKALLLVTGILCGLLPGVRITSSIFPVAITLYIIWRYHKAALPFLLGLSSIAFHLLWNFYYFGWDNILVGGYIKHLEERPTSYAFTLKQFTTASLGLLISPSDGFFTYSPVLLFSVAGTYQVFKRRLTNDEKLVLMLTSACFVVYLHYCFYLFWMGGSDSYGSRVLTDTLPVACLLIAYFLSAQVTKLEKSGRWLNSILILFLISLFFSTGVQAVGAFTQTNWGASPLPIFANKSRVWSLRDSQIERHFHNLVAQITHPIKDKQTYSQNLQASIEAVVLINREGEEIPIEAGKIVADQRRILKAQLKNTGKSTWFGYQTGLNNEGETRLKVRFYNSKNSQTAKQRGGDQLYISGTPKSGEVTEATGLIAFPKQPGQYRVEFDLVAIGVSKGSDRPYKESASYEIEILPKRTNK